MRWPGIEPGSIAWKATMLTFIPPSLIFAEPTALVVTELLEVISAAVWRLGIPKQWNESITISIHKKGSSSDLGNFRPISLLPRMYKIFSAIVSQRLAHVAVGKWWISPSQKKFLPALAPDSRQPPKNSYWDTHTLTTGRSLPSAMKRRRSSSQLERKKVTHSAPPFSTSPLNCCSLKGLVGVEFRGAECHSLRLYLYKWDRGINNHSEHVSFLSLTPKRGQERSSMLTDGWWLSINAEQLFHAQKLASFLVIVDGLSPIFKWETRQDILQKWSCEVWS